LEPAEVGLLYSRGPGEAIVATGFFYASPIFLALGLLMVPMGQMVGKKEGWSRSDALYFTFITASTVGYGDLKPTKLLAAGIGLVSILLTGMVTALGVHAAQEAFRKVHLS
jgi:hypothetical protein